MKSEMQLIAQSLLLVMLAACSHQKPAPADTGSAPVVLDQRLAALATGPQGYVCEGSDTYHACACVQGSVGKWTCSGMAKMCRDSGAGTPKCSDGVCACEILY